MEDSMYPVTSDYKINEDVGQKQTDTMRIRARISAISNLLESCEGSFSAQASTLFGTPSKGQQAGDSGPVPVRSAIELIDEELDRLERAAQNISEFVPVFGRL